jgi:hypothetical protein
MQLNILSGTIDESYQTNVKEIKEVVSSSLREVRALSRSLNNEVVEYAGLEVSVKGELSRFERLNIIKTTFISIEDPFEIPQKDAIILFRILQEFFSNVIKHSKASKLDVEFRYSENELFINTSDNGKGFDPEEVEKSSGMFNMKSRAELIKTDFILNSSDGNGTSLSLCYPTKTLQNE